MKADISSISGQGEPQKVKQDMLLAIVEGLDNVRAESAGDIWTRRRWADNVRYCHWEGQSPDGRKRAEYLSDDPFPFEGASDARVRLADFLLRVITSTLKQSAKRASVRVRGVAANDAQVAGNINMLANWLLNNRMAGSWRMHLERLIQWGQGDSPACSLLHVYQDRKTNVRMEKFDLEDILIWLEENVLQGGEGVGQGAGGMGQGGEGMGPGAGGMGEEGVGAGMIGELQDLIMDEGRADQLIAIVRTKFPKLKESTIKKSLKGFRETGSAMFPMEYISHDEPRVEALRMWDDVFVPVYTRDPETCQVVYVRRWMNRSELKSKVENEGWDKAAVEELIGKQDGSGGYEGESYVTEADIFSSSHTRLYDDTQTRTNQFEVLYAYIRGATEDGVEGIFVVPFSGFVDKAFADMELLDYPHGGMPFVWYVREYTSKNLLDSRGVCELVQTDQDHMKRTRDTASDHMTVFTMPPYVHNMISPEREIRFSSLSLIRVGNTQSLKPLEIPNTDDLPLQHMETLQKAVSQYFAVPLTEINQNLQAIMTQDMVDDFMDVLKQALHMLIQLAVTYMDEDQLAGICEDPEMDMEAMREGVRTLRDVEVEFSAAGLDVEYLSTLSGIIKDTLLTIDSDSTIMRNELVDWLCRQINPSLANKILRPIETATESEVRDEQINFALIASGIEPPMKEGGQNFKVRLDTLQQTMEQNPESVQKMSPTSLEILQARIQQLSGQVMQQENAVTGRTMGQKVLS